MKTQLLLLACFPLFLQAQITTIPDPVFEEALVELDLDDIIDGSVLTANINTVSSLNVSAKGISDMTGIEDFTWLESLYISENNLTEIDLSGNPVLSVLSVSLNSLTELDLTYNTELQYIYCNANDLASINLSACDVLLELACIDNEITAFDFTNNLNLRSVICYKNELTTLDLSAQLLLETLLCDSNKLEFVNIQNGHNGRIEYGNFSAIANPNLFCIQVDDDTYAIDTWADGIDDHTEFNEFCGVGLDQETTVQINLYPNPTSGTLFIESQANENYQLYNVQGQSVSSGELKQGTNILKLDDLSEGLYFLKVGNRSQSAIRKIILQNK